LIAATQDFITASFLLSKKDRFYNKAQFAQICTYLGDGLMDIDLPHPAIFKPGPLWTGKQVFNVLLCPKKNSGWPVNLATKCRTYDKDQKDRNGIRFSQAKNIAGLSPDLTMCANDGYFMILNGEIISGVVDKAIVGDGSKNSLFYVVLRDFGSVAAAECMNRLAKLSARWLANQGFSIGIDDVQPGSRLSKEKEFTVEKGYSECDDAIRLSKEGKLANQAGLNQDETLEVLL
jgi:DNA-directed RNA polymerase III subunit RPC1